MSLRKYITGLAVAVLALLSLGAFTTEATAAVACPEESPTVYAGGYIELDLMCYDARVQHDGYHLFATDSDNPPNLGGTFSSYYMDEGGIEHNLLGYFPYVGASGTDTIDYVLRKGTTGDDFVTGSIDVDVEAVPATTVAVERLLTKKHSATDKWTRPTDTPGRYRLRAGTYQESQPRIDKLIKANNLSWNTRLKNVDYEVYLIVDGQWYIANAGHINNRTGKISEADLGSSVMAKPIATKASLRPMAKPPTWGALR